MKAPSSGSKLFWLPRILAIAFLLFLMIFSFDVFEEPGSLLYKMAGFLIHNLPSIILALILFLFWKNSYRAGLAVFIYTILFIVVFRILLQGWGPFLFFTVPLFLISGLFFLDHRRLSRHSEVE